MARLLLLIVLIHAPLFAVTPGDKSPLELKDVRVSVDLSMDGAKVTSKATIHNPGDEAVGATLTLPRELIPDKQRTGFKLKIAGIARESKSATEFQWDVNFQPDDQLEVAWTYQLKPVDLPHAHPLGLRSVRVVLAHMRGYAAVPDRVVATITSTGMSAGLFENRDGDTETLTVSVEAHVEDINYTWFAETWDARHKSLSETRASFSEDQRTHKNRSYTETLVHLADLYTLKAMPDDLAAVCDELARLERQAKTAITHCGPSANWRKHVPWQLRRVQALKDADNDTAQAAEQAREYMEVLWSGYLAARDEPHPFDHFDRTKYGNYWDYDWDRTRELYAATLELLGDAEAAKSVRETE